VLSPKKKIFALTDSNNFYVSCERVWNPKLRDVPVLVLSNNDGCAIARSSEVKALGIRMAQPYFKIKDICRENGVHVYSANFSLYADFSSRVINTLRDFTPSLEVYSIDESFLDLTGVKEDLFEYGKKIRAKVLKNVGIPTSTGIAYTKTLAKVANKLAKSHRDFKEAGVCDLTKFSEEEVDELLKEFYVGDIWGIGWSTTPKLLEYGIDTAYKLKYADKNWIKKVLKVIGSRTVMELNGISCLPMSLVRDHLKSIASTRSFGKPVETLLELEEAVTLYTSRAAEKLRKEKCIASGIHIFIKTNKHKRHLPQYSNSISVTLPEGSLHTPELVKAALSGLRKIYKSGVKYKKAGVVFFAIEKKDSILQDLFDMDKGERFREKEKAMMAIDRVNRKWGTDSIFLASRGVKQAWRMRAFNKSPRYNTSWLELPEVRV
jgi:DNA polymerase V